MLERLDDIDWSKLSHAYGEATNVPDMLRGLASPDRDEREGAFDGLFWSIHHQGTIYDSSAYAVPFLIELASSPQVQGRQRILTLLVALTGGYGYVQVHGRLDSPQVQASAEFRETLAQERSCQEAVRAAVWKGWSVFLGLLRDPEPRLRRGALRLLGRLMEHARPELPGAVAQMVGLLREDDSGKAAILRLLGRATRYHAAAELAREAARDHHEHDIELFNGGGADEEEEEAPAWLEPTEEERTWGRAAVAAMWQGWEVYEGCLRDAPAAVREGVLFLQSALLAHAAQEAPPGSEPEGLRRHLLARWGKRLRKGGSERMQADLLFALAAVGPQEPEVRAALREVLEGNRSRFVSYVAALKLADLEGGVSGRGLDLLIEAHLEGGEIYSWLRKLPRWDNYLAIARLRRLGPTVIDQRLDRLVEVVRGFGAGGGFGAGKAREVLSLAFAAGPLPAGSTVADLTEGQRQLLLAAADNGLYWGRLANNDLELQRYGLPRSRRALRKFLARPGEPVPGPRNDPEDALVIFEQLVRRALPFAVEADPYQREEDDTRAPSRVIKESVERLRRIEEGYRPKDRPQIKKLEVCGYACDALLALVPLCPNLRDLDLAWGEITDAGLVHLARLPHLQKLDLFDNGITDAGLAHLAGLSGLRELGLGATDITDEGLAHLAGLTKLRKMHLGATLIRGPGLAHLQGLTHLEELWFCSDHLTDEATPLLAQLRALKKLDYGGPQVSGRGLEAWSALRHLRELSLRATALAVEALAAFPPLAALESLDFWSTPVTDAHVRALPPLPALASLNLYHSAVTDDALEGLERFPKLNRLNLSGTAVTDAGARHLLRLKDLTWVGLFDTRVSDAAVKDLQRAFPEAAFGK